MSFDQSIIEFDNDNYNNQELKACLERFGVSIIKNVLDPEYCDNTFYEICDTLNYVTSNLDKPFDVNNSSTWNTLEKLKPVKGMIFQNWGLGHCQPIWNLRCNRNIINVFEKIYETNDLLVSYDAFSFLPPPEITRKNWHSNSWYHCDQKLSNDFLECYQGWISLTDTDIGDATLSVILKSHRMHYDFKRIFNIEEKGDFVMMKDHIDELLRMFPFVEHRITCPKGSLVLWDSRLLHSGDLPLKTRKNANFRCVSYLCYTPRSLCTPSNLKRKKQLLYKRGNNGYLRTTNHYPHRPVMFPEIPRFCDKNLSIVKLPDPFISEEFNYLTGF